MNIPFRLSKALNQRGSLHLLVPVLAVVAVGVAAMQFAMVSHAAKDTAKVASKKVVPPITNVAYASSSPQQVLDIFPASTANAPLVVVVHGGGWTTNDKSDFKPQAVQLQKEGFAVFNINYRLDSSTVAAFPMETADVQAATQWAIAHAATYNANPAKVVLFGGSAGGQLVGYAAEQLNATASGTVKGVITLSGPTDFVSLVQEDKNGSLGTKGTDKNFEANIPQALGCSLNTCTTAVETQWSPAEQATSANCPAAWLSFNSQSELIPLEQQNSLVTALHQQGCTITPVVVSGSKHSTAYWSTVKAQVFSFIAGL